MLRNLLIGAAVVASSLFSFTTEATAGSYGNGANYFEICNESTIPVAFETDETSFTHLLDPGQCDTIWTNWDYIEVYYDDSDAYGWQNYSVTVYYPDDLAFYTLSDDGFEIIIDHYLW